MLVSVLISCYNVERYIDRGIGSIIAQTYSDCEFIIVDDGSVDNTYNKCLEWAKRDSRIKLVQHEKNLGLGAARNTGLNHARGKYIYFFDVDDLASPDLVTTCIKSMEYHKSEMMIFGFNAISPERPNEIDKVIYKERNLKSNTEIRNIFVDEIMLARHGSGFAWNKFYLRAFIEKNNLRFGTQAIQQDQPFTLQALSKVNLLYISPEVLYTYFIYSKGNNASRHIPDRMSIYLDIDSHYESLLSDWNLKSQKTDNFLNNRIYTGLLKYINYDLKHSDCNLTHKERKQIFNQLTKHPRIKKSILSKRESKDIRTFITSYLLRPNFLWLYRIYQSLENVFRKILKH